jgi:hypothetical protein
MAAEDGVVLAKCLRDLPDLPRALEAYERLRRRRVERIVAQGARTGSAKTPGPSAACCATCCCAGAPVPGHRPLPGLDLRPPPRPRG